MLFTRSLKLNLVYGLLFPWLLQFCCKYRTKKNDIRNTRKHSLCLILLQLNHIPLRDHFSLIRGMKKRPPEIRKCIPCPLERLTQKVIL